MDELNISLVTVGGVILAFGAISGVLRQLSIAEPLLAFVVGVVLGPTVLGVLDPAQWGDEKVILQEAARLTLAIGLTAVALRVPRGFPFATWRSLAVLLLLGMLGMWLTSSLLVYLLLGLPLWVALLVGAVVTPTDPVVAASIVTGKPAQEHLPYRLRHLISTESGFNDGLAYPFVFLPILWLTMPPAQALNEWLLRVLVREIGGAILFGTFLGLATGWLLRWAREHGIIEKPSFLAYILALAFLALGAGKLIGTNGVLVVFITGVAFGTVVSVDEQAREESVLEAIDRFFLTPIFVLLGLAIPWEKWVELGWQGIVLVATVLLLRRLPTVLALTPFVRRLHGIRDATFTGWFGPIGVAALFYASLAREKTAREETWVVASLLICASLLAHGLSATPLTVLYGRWRERDYREARNDERAYSPPAGSHK